MLATAVTTLMLQSLVGHCIPDFIMGGSSVGSSRCFIEMQQYKPLLDTACVFAGWQHLGMASISMGARDQAI